MTDYIWTDQCEAIARLVASDFFLPRADHEDLVQEARIGVTKALRDYRPGKGASFNTFARLCARREVITAIKSANAIKHQALNHATCMDGPVDRNDPDSPLLLDAVSQASSAEDTALAKQQTDALLAGIANLTPLERRALIRCTINGEAYAALGNKKRIDNAIQRARVKLRTVLDEAA